MPKNWIEFSLGIMAALIPYLAPAATLIVGLSVAFIAWHQWRVARNKLRMDLFEAQGRSLLICHSLPAPAHWWKKQTWIRFGKHLPAWHKGIFTGNNEGYSEVPDALLRTIGDVRYAAFVATQSAQVRQAALSLLRAHTQDFARTYPRTKKLYHAWIASQRHTSNQSLEPTAGRRTARV